jgi:clan AA aspartic protease
LGIVRGTGHRAVDCFDEKQFDDAWISPGGTVSDGMGTFRIDIEIENPARPGERLMVASALVDTGAELTWVPATVLETLGVRRLKTWRFRQADGTILERYVGSALVYAAGTVTTDDVVFGAPGDMVLLGARTLEGLNLRVDPRAKQLIDAGPAPAACAA